VQEFELPFLEFPNFVRRLKPFENYVIHHKNRLALPNRDREGVGALD
jgi:hypothetical protein